MRKAEIIFAIFNRLFLGPFSMQESVGGIKPFGYRPDIDGLRAIAVILVVAFHIGVPGFGAGFIGVDVFFVISGFLITTLLVNELQGTGRINFLKFYARRIRRLLPAIICVIGAVTCVSLFLLHPYGQQQELAKSAIAALLFVSNLYFSYTTGGYFDTPESEVPLLHFWSLSVEEQFYLFWPLVLILMGILGSSISGKRLNVLLVGTVFLVLLSFVYSLQLTSSSMSSAYFLMPARAWQLLTGAATALLLLSTSNRYLPVVAVSALYIVSGALLGVGFWVIAGPKDYPGWPAILPTLATALFIAIGAMHERSVAKNMLATAPCVFLGKLSFSWYLWHWPCIALGKMYFLGVESITRNILLAGLSLVFAILTYYFVEQRFRKAPVVDAVSSRKIMGVGVSATVFVVIVAGLVGLSARHADSYQPWWDIDKRLEQVRFARPEFRRGCHQDVPFDSLSIRNQCVTGASQRGTQALLWGDSHADHLSPLMDKFGVTQKRGILQRSFSRCRPLLDEYSYLDNEVSRHCRGFHKAVMEEAAILKGQGLEGVVISGYWGGEFKTLLDTEEGRKAFKVGLSGTVSKLVALGLKVLIVQPTPDLRFHPLGCMARNLGAKCGISRKQWEDRREYIYGVINGIAQENTNVRTLDLTDFFCGDSHCGIEKDGLILFRDNNHITPDAARSLVAVANTKLSWVTGLSYSTTVR